MAFASAIPQHVAVIMDGNGRWAKQKGMPRIKGHQAGVNAAKTIVEAAVKAKINYLTLFAFSSENWRRPEAEVEHIFQLFLEVLHHDLEELHSQQIKIQIIGDKAGLSQDSQQAITVAEQLTADNQGLHLIIALNYGGRWDLCQAAQRMAQAVQQGKLMIQEITPDQFAQYLSTAGIPDPDLFIRPSGEQRISNFLLWQLAYAELYFSAVYWPDFNEEEFAKALAFYQSRQRRFGYTDEQLTAQEGGSSCS